MKSGKTNLVHVYLTREAVAHNGFALWRQPIGCIWAHMRARNGQYL